jgi:ribosomal protein S18 acetylase RimI-like enzyme
VVSGNHPTHFTLAAVEQRSEQVVGYVHCTLGEETNHPKLNIAHLKVGRDHQGQGLGAGLIDAAEQWAKQRRGWSCSKSTLTVLKNNLKAKRCYEKSRFRFVRESEASFPPEEHTKPEDEVPVWQRMIRTITE